ncbi:7049_t:CDS:2 [Funneliformis mosseae]|uniref:7049_t:CDS:1 n=1 Tax=Funneliformis mosseae TaxID=27381 RepID=A0A9N8WCI8_FUNMO|nr:7049_t:CDS:2 [Funneliformis mosseae]
MFIGYCSICPKEISEHYVSLTKVSSKSTECHVTYESRNPNKLFLEQEYIYMMTFQREFKVVTAFIYLQHLATL